jgi:hypothetical protein
MTATTSTPIFATTTGPGIVSAVAEATEAIPTKMEGKTVAIAISPK